MIAEELYFQMADYAAANPEVERCGVVLSSYTHPDVFVPVPNTSPDPATGFDFGWHETLECMAKEGIPSDVHGVLTLFHSHPHDRPASHHDRWMLGKLLQQHGPRFVWSTQALICCPTEQTWWIYTVEASWRF